MKKTSKKSLPSWIKQRTTLLFFLLAAACIFLRFYELPQRAGLGWDQADSAWAAKSILEDNPIRLEGVPVKGNAGMYLGPLYYYLIAPFYYFTNRDMIASPMFAGVVSVISFIVFFLITKKLFETKTALVALFIYTFSLAVINFDRGQAAFVLVPTLSYVVFFCLFKIITGQEKHILSLAAVLGFGFHIHITTIFYLIIILLTLPFFPRTRKTLLYTLLAIPLFTLFIAPMLYALFFAKQATSNNFTTYGNTYYHGFHVRRLLQITSDAFISFQQVLQFKILQPLAFAIAPVFLFLYSGKHPGRNRLLFAYLVVLWIVVPWVMLSTYSGELTDYYFSLPRNLAIVMVAYLLISLYAKKSFVLKGVVVLLMISYAGYNLWSFSQGPYGNYLGITNYVRETIRNNQKIEFKDRDPAYYMYEMSTRKPAEK